MITIIFNFLLCYLLIPTQTTYGAQLDLLQLSSNLVALNEYSKKSNEAKVYEDKADLEQKYKKLERDKKAFDKQHTEFIRAEKDLIVAMRDTNRAKEQLRQEQANFDAALARNKQLYLQQQKDLEQERERQQTALADRARLEKQKLEVEQNKLQQNIAQQKRDAFAALDKEKDQFNEEKLALARDQQAHQRELERLRHEHKQNEQHKEALQTERTLLAKEQKEHIRKTEELAQQKLDLIKMRDFIKQEADQAQKATESLKLEQARFKQEQEEAIKSLKLAQAQFKQEQEDAIKAQIAHQKFLDEADEEQKKEAQHQLTLERKRLQAERDAIAQEKEQLKQHEENVKATLHKEVLDLQNKTRQYQEQRESLERLRLEKQKEAAQALKDQFEQPNLLPAPSGGPIVATLSTSSQDLAEKLKQDLADKSKKQNGNGGSHEFVESGELITAEDLPEADRYREGKALVNAILKGEKVEPSVEKLIPIVSYLYYLAEHGRRIRGELSPLEEFAFIIEDPQDRIFNFLKNIPGASTRISSHYKERATSQYGIDVPLADASKGTVLFAQLKPIVEQNFMHQTFIKPENYGVGLTDFLPHALEFIQAQARKQPFLQKVFGMRPEEDPAYQKEHTPQWIKDRGLKLIKQVKQDKNELAVATKLFTSDAGISALIPKLAEYRAQIAQQAQQAGDEKERARLTALAQDFDSLKTDIIKVYAVDWNIRKGNEIIFRTENLAQTPPTLSELRKDEPGHKQEAVQPQQPGQHPLAQARIFERPAAQPAHFAGGGAAIPMAAPVPRRPALPAQARAALAVAAKTASPQKSSSSGVQKALPVAAAAAQEKKQ